MTEEQLRAELHRLRPGLHFEPARHGMILGDGEPWPR
jgi:hypothetical protein